jgi:hypothetical protein
MILKFYFLLVFKLYFSHNFLNGDWGLGIGGWGLGGGGARP